MATNQQDNRLFKREPAAAVSVSQNGYGAHETPESEAKQNAALFVGITAGEASRMGYWVKCDLPAYEGLSVLYRTNNQTRVRRDRPSYVEPRELVQARAELARANRVAATLAEDAPVDERVSVTEAVTAATRQVIAATEAYLDEYHAAQCRWLSRFVIGFNPWPFDDVACPHPDEPDSYIVLHEELEDLYAWLMGPGYQAALVEATGN